MAQHGKEEHSSEQYGIAQQSMAQDSKEQNSTAQHCETYSGKAQYGTAWYGMAQQAQHGTRQQGTTKQEQAALQLFTLHTRDGTALHGTVSTAKVYSTSSTHPAPWGQHKYGTAGVGSPCPGMAPRLPLSSWQQWCRGQAGPEKAGGSSSGGHAQCLSSACTAALCPLSRSL